MAVLFVLCGACHPQKPTPTKPTTLTDTVVASREGFVKVHVPAGDGWHCNALDLDKTTFQQRGVKCTQDAGIVLYAKVIDVDTNDARTAELFCIQDWKQEYSKIFTGVQKYTHDVVDWHGTPACEVVIEGSSQKGAWHLWELHAPNGKRLLQLTVSAFMPAYTARKQAVDDWLADVQYDLKVPGQK